MTVSSTTSTSSAYQDTTTESTANKTSLNSDDFLKLLAVQFQSQDPMKPMEDTAFIAQMAQFTALEQSSTMSAKMAELLDAQNLATANSYIGHQVTFLSADETYVTGTVDGVEVTSDGPRLIVGDYTYALDSIVTVQPVPAATTAADTTNETSS